ncbi:MAG: AAA family ATPase [Bacteroidota bacterium]
MVTLALYNLKGGVGKTAGCVNLAYLAAAEGHKVLVWDLDPQAAASFYFKTKPNPKNSDTKKILAHETDLASAIHSTEFQLIDIIPADLSARQADVQLNDMKQGKKRLKSLLSSIKGKYDYVFLDCPPGLNLLHEAVFNAADTIVMPTIPTTLSIRSYEMVKAFIKEHELAAKLACYFSMADLRKTLHNETLEAHYRNKDFLKNYIPYLSDVEKMGVNKAPVMEFANSGYAAQCYRDVWKELQKHV